MGPRPETAAPLSNYAPNDMFEVAEFLQGLYPAEDYQVDIVLADAEGAATDLHLWHQQQKQHQQQQHRMDQEQHFNSQNCDPNQVTPDIVSTMGITNESTQKPPARPTGSRIRQRRQRTEKNKFQRTLDLSSDSREGLLEDAEQRKAAIIARGPRPRSGQLFDPAWDTKKLQDNVFSETAHRAEPLRSHEPSSRSVLNPTHTTQRRREFRYQTFQREDDSNDYNIRHHHQQRQQQQQQHHHHCHQERPRPPTVDSLPLAQLEARIPDIERARSTQRSRNTNEESNSYTTAGPFSSSSVSLAEARAFASQWRSTQQASAFPPNK